MNIAIAGCLGLIGGAILGAFVGLGAGLAWTTLAHTSSFEGYSGMLVAFTFLPLGAIAGGLTGAIWLGRAAARP